MTFAQFRCCITPIALSQYEASTNAVLRALGIEFSDVREFNCCGYPLKNLNFKAYVLASARNLAIARKLGLDILTVCNCCYGSLKHVGHLLESDAGLRKEINATLGKEGLKVDGDWPVKHLLEVLHDVVGPENLRRRLKLHLNGLRVAVHYGCHILRPSKIVQFDAALSPVKFDRLVEATGAEALTWSNKLECCGSPLIGIHDELSMDLTEKKLTSARNAGADCLCVACPYCQMQFDQVQELMVSHRGWKDTLPSILYPQLLGLCLGIDPETLGIGRNRLRLTVLQRFLQDGRGRLTADSS